MKQEIRDLQLLNTKKLNDKFFDSELTIVIKGQKALTVGQLVSINKMFINWDNWIIKLAVWLISKTNYANYE